MKHKDIIDKLTLKEKCYMLSGRDFWHTRSNERLKIPSMTLSDGPHGIRQQEGSTDHLGINKSIPATCYPTAASMANSWNEELGEMLGDYLGKEAAIQNVGVLLGPGLNMKRSPLCGRNFEYFSEDPYLAGKMAAAYIRGIQKHGIAACPKHFAVNSQELRRMASDSILDERTLREIYLTAFEIAVKEGKPKSIMSAYNKVNGIYANENEHLLTEILRDEWGFDGFVVSDWGASNDHVKGVKAGSNLEMPSTGGDSDEKLIKAVKDNKLSQKIIDKNVDELLDVILSSYKACMKEKDEKIDIKKHHLIARRAAAETAVLLKNEDNILPLKEGTKVALIGEFAKNPRYQGAGSSLVNSTKETNALETIKKHNVELVGFANGFRRDGKSDEKMQKEAIKLAKKADVIILYLGLNEINDSEGIDRLDMKLPKVQTELLSEIQKVNKNIIVVLSCGGAIEMPWEDKCKGLIHGYLGGQAGAEAMLDIIMGKVNPSGKLAETIPNAYSDTPAYNYFPGRGRNAQYREGLYIGYRYYDTVNEDVRFPFGYGLSYTTFEYSNLEINGNAVSFDIKNTGKMKGAEIAQIYIRAAESKIFRAKKELKGFTKVFLEPGEVKRVTIQLDDKAFRYFNINTNKFEIEECDYEIIVAASSRDERLKQTVHIMGTDAPNPYEGKKLESYFTGNIKNVSDKEFETLLGYRPDDKNSNKKFDINDPVCHMNHSKSILGRIVYKIMNSKMQKSIEEGNPNLNLSFNFNMPLRAMCKMSDGFISEFMVRGIVKELNGLWIIGLCQFIIGFPIQLIKKIRAGHVK